MNFVGGKLECTLILESVLSNSEMCFYVCSGGWPFDPLNLSGDVESFEDLKVKEMKNGRLAMVAWLGFFVQAAVTQKGPLQNLLDFWDDPAHNNVFGYLRGEV